MYANVDLLYHITDAQVTVSPVLIHLPRLDDKETVMIKQNWPEDQLFTFETIPYVEVTVYAGTTLTMLDGSQPDPFPLIALEVPVDRLPDQMPPNDFVEPFFIAFQQANSTASQPVAVTYPNTLNTPPGTRVTLSTLDPTKGVMVNYGTGTISADGTKIIPDFDPAYPGNRYGLVHFDWHGFNVRANPENPNGGCNNGNSPKKINSGGSTGGCPRSKNPVDYTTGLEIIIETDLALSSGRGNIAIERVYRTKSTIAGPFGIGSSHRYGYRLNSNTPKDEELINLISPAGTLIPLSKGVDGLFSNSSRPSASGVKLEAFNDGSSQLRWKDGVIYQFIPETAFNGSVLSAIIDPNGNKITINRNPNALEQITEVVDPSGRKLRLAYDNNSRITSVFDPIGRTVTYT